MTLQLSFDPGALLLGGTGRVGSGIARLMARAGVPVVVTYRSDAGRAEALVAEIKAAGGTIIAVSMDMNDRASVQAALDRAAAFGGGLRHVMLANGPLMPFGKIADIDEDELVRFLLDDAVGATRVARMAVPLLRQSGGSLTFCTTIANFRVVINDGASPFSKGAVEALMRQLASEEAAHAIRANSVAVSWVSDRSVEEQMADLAFLSAEQYTAVEPLMAQLANESPLRRPASSEEAAWLFAFLASQQASYITGQTIRLDGAFSLGGVVS